MSNNDMREALAARLARAWAEGYQAGINDERASEANIGIAGFGAKVQPARNNPYAAAPAPVAQPLTDQQIDALSDEVFDLIADMPPDADVGSRTWDRMFARAVIAKIESTGQEGGAA